MLIRSVIFGLAMLTAGCATTGTNKTAGTPVERHGQTIQFPANSDSFCGDTSKGVIGLAAFHGFGQNKQELYKSARNGDKNEPWFDARVQVYDQVIPDLVSANKLSSVREGDYGYIICSFYADPQHSSAFIDAIQPKIRSVFLSCHKANPRTEPYRQCVTEGMEKLKAKSSL